MPKPDNPNWEAIVADFDWIAGWLASRHYSRRRDNSDDRDDLKQVARLHLIRAARRWEGEPGDPGLRAYLVKSIRGRLARHVQTNRMIRPPRETSDRFAAEVPVDRVDYLGAVATAPEPRETHPADEPLSKSMSAALDQLTEKEREAVERLTISGEELADVARELGVKPSTLHSRHQSGVDKLRRILTGGSSHELDPADPRIVAAVDQLSDNQRAIIQRCWIGPERVCDVARELGITPRAGHDHRRHGLAKLRRLMLGI